MNGDRNLAYLLSAGILTGTSVLTVAVRYSRDPVRRAALRSAFTSRRSVAWGSVTAAVLLGIGLVDRGSPALALVGSLLAGAAVAGVAGSLSRRPDRPGPTGDRPA